MPRQVGSTTQGLLAGGAHARGRCNRRPRSSGRQLAHLPHSLPGRQRAGRIMPFFSLIPSEFGSCLRAILKVFATGTCGCHSLRLVIDEFRFHVSAAVDCAAAQERRDCGLGLSCRGKGIRGNRRCQTLRARCGKAMQHDSPKECNERAAGKCCPLHSCALFHLGVRLHAVASNFTWRTRTKQLHTCHGAANLWAFCWHIRGHSAC